MGVDLLYSTACRIRHNGSRSQFKCDRLGVVRRTVTAKNTFGEGNMPATVKITLFLCACVCPATIFS